MKIVIAQERWRDKSKAEGWQRHMGATSCIPGISVPVPIVWWEKGVVRKGGGDPQPHSPAKSGSVKVRPSDVRMKQITLNRNSDQKRHKYTNSSSLIPV